jgi:putative ABC transport system permease protein
VKKRIELSGAQYGVSVYGSDLEMAINSYSNRMVSFRLIMLALSLPVIALGFYLGILGVELGMNERRREIGILKSRGVSNKQILLMLLFESIILGVIAGIIGLLCGLLSSRFFLGLGGQEIGLFDIAVSNASITISILLAIILMLIAVVRPARRISKIPIVEALHHYSKEEVKKRYKPTRDIIMILIASLTYFFMVTFDPSTFFSGSFTFLTLIALIFFMLAPILIPFSPFFLIFGLTRLLTRSTNKIYSAVSHATKFFTKDMWHIVNKNLARNPKRASRVCVIISLALAFGIFTMVFMDTSIAFEERKIRAEIGSDIHIISYTENMSFERKLSAIDGVDMVASASFTSCNVGSEYASISAFNSSAYCEIVDLEDYYFIEGNPGVLTTLADGENAVINKRLADEYGFNVGDMLPVQVYHYEGFAEGTTHTFNYQITGIVKYLPGLQLWGYGVYGDNMVFVDLSRINVTLFDHGESCFLVKVKNGFSHEEIANDIENLYPNEASDIKVFQVEFDRVKNDPMFSAFLYFLTVEYAFVLLIATVGIGLIMFVAAREREQEIANIIARGASTKQIFSLFLGEGLTIMLIGILIGSGTGLLTAYAFNEMISIDPYQLVERTLILSPSLALLIFASIIALIFTITMVSLQAARIKLHQALRIRGG